METNTIDKKKRNRIAVYLDDETLFRLRRERLYRGKPVGHIVEDLVRNDLVSRSSCRKLRPSDI